MLQNLLSKLKKSLLLAMLALSFPQISRSDTLQMKKDIFLIDVSRSMQGQGSVSTPNVFDEVKRELSSALSKAKHSRAVLIPFSDKVRAGLSVELPQDSFLVSSYIKRLNTSEGRTDIYRAWMAGLDSLHSDASGNRLYLITDALHNSKKYSLDSLRSLLSLWEGENKEAYHVLLDPAFDSSELASAFRSHERMHVVNSLQGMYDQVELDTIQKEDAVVPAKVVNSMAQGDEPSLWWLWVLFVVLLAGVVTYIAGKLGLFRSTTDSAMEGDNDVLIQSEAEVPVDKRPDVADEIGDSPEERMLEGNTEEEDAEREAMEVPTGARALAVVEGNNGLEPAINNLKKYGDAYPQEFNEALHAERRKAVTPSHQFPTAYQLEHTQAKQIIGREPSGMTLRSNLLAVMDPKLARIIEAFGGAVAHHVVEGRDPAAERSRKILEKFGIDINDAANGIFLPDGSEESIFKGPAHKTSHTKEYSEYVYNELMDCKSREEVIAKLTSIKHAIYDRKVNLQGERQVYNKNIRSKS